MGGIDRMGFEAYLQFGLALLFVLALVGIIALIARRSGLAPRFAAGRGKIRRLSLVEVMPLDNRRRLVLVRRDGVEHLLLLGPERATVIETGIATALDTAAAETVPSRPAADGRGGEHREPTL